MLDLNLDNFVVEFTDGSVQNVGAPNESATAKLFDVASVEAREFGDRQVKVVAEDESGNVLQIALSPEQGESIVDGVDAMRDDSPGFE